MTTESTTLLADTTASTTGGEQGQADAGASQQTAPPSQTTEGQGQQGTEQTAEGEGSKQQATEPQVPETYTFEMPEGVTLDETAVAEFSTIAKELKLTQEQASKIAQIQVAAVQRQFEAFENQIAEWGTQAAADKEFGGDALQENLGLAKVALKEFGTPELDKLLSPVTKGGMGLGNHPEVIRMLVRVGKAISSDGFVKGGTSTPAKPFYENSNMKTT